MAKRTYTFFRTVIITCSQCNENIVDRADERDVDTMAKAREYAREHEAGHKHDEALTRRLSSGEETLPRSRRGVVDVGDS